MPTHAIIRTSEPELVAIYQRKTIFTNDEFKALPTTPLEIVPAQGAGTLIHVCEVLFNLNIPDGGYLNAGTDPMIDKIKAIYYNGGYVGDASTEILGISIDEFTPDFLYSMMGIGIRTDAGPFNKTVLGNKPVYISIQNDVAGNFTGGGANNSFEVTALYSIIDL